jgi:hypothetical protein
MIYLMRFACTIPIASEYKSSERRVLATSNIIFVFGIRDSISSRGMNNVDDTRIIDCDLWFICVPTNQYLRIIWSFLLWKVLFSFSLSLSFHSVHPHFNSSTVRRRQIVVHLLHTRLVYVSQISRNQQRRFKAIKL